MIVNRSISSPPSLRVECKRDCSAHEFGLRGYLAPGELVEQVDGQQQRISHLCTRVMKIVGASWLALNLSGKVIIAVLAQRRWKRNSVSSPVPRSPRSR